MSIFLIALFVISTGIFGLGKYVKTANAFKENENASKFFIKVQFSLIYAFYSILCLWGMLAVFKLAFSGPSWMPDFGGWSLLVIIGVLVGLIVAGLGTIVQIVLIPALYIVYKVSIYLTSFTYASYFNWRNNTNYCFDTILAGEEDSGSGINIEFNS